MTEAEELADWYIGLNWRIAKKLKAEPYKPLDRDGLVGFFGRFLEEQDSLQLGEQASRLLSGLAFGQFLPNANHRTAITLVSLWLGLNRFDITLDGEFEAAARRFVQGSKEDIGRAYSRAAQFQGAKRQSYLWEKYWTGHLRSTKVFLENFSVIKEAIQSGRWGRMPASRLEILLTVSSVEV